MKRTKTSKTWYRTKAVFADGSDAVFANWASNPLDAAGDRYDRGLTVSPWATYDALKNTSTDNGSLALRDCRDLRLLPREAVDRRVPRGHRAELERLQEHRGGLRPGLRLRNWITGRRGAHAARQRQRGSSRRHDHGGCRRQLRHVLQAQGIAGHLHRVRPRPWAGALGPALGERLGRGELPYRAAFPFTPLHAPSVVGTTPAARALEKALVPYRKGDYTAAASALDGVLLDHPGDSQAALYLGISRLFMDEVPNALEILRPLATGTPADVAAEAAWYGLVGFARLRDPSGVEAEARALCAAAGATGPRACAALEALEKARAVRPAGA